MTLNDTVNLSFAAIKSQPLRVVLIILAMAIGITSVTVLTALGESARRYVVNEFEALGTHLIIVLPGRSETTGGHPPLLGTTPRDLTIADTQALTKSQHIVAIAPISIGTAPVSTKGLEREANIIGSTASLRQVRHLSLSHGQFLPKNDMTKALSVCVIGQTIKNELFAHNKAIGQWLRINDHRFRVIGILASEGQSIGVDFDDMVIIPVASAQALFNTQSLFRILAEAKSTFAMHKAVDEIRQTIKLRHEGEDDITLITQDSVVNTFDEILSALTLTVASIASISLAVAGILVMNVMWVSVTQRTAEIGLLKALGATQQHILWLFLTEAIILAIAGAVTGLLFGKLTLLILQTNYPDFPFILPTWAIFAALTVSLLTALLFSVLPAKQAAKMNPVTALNKR